MGNLNGADQKVSYISRLTEPLTSLRHRQPEFQLGSALVPHIDLTSTVAAAILIAAMSRTFEMELSVVSRWNVPLRERWVQGLDLLRGRVSSVFHTPAPHVNRMLPLGFGCMNERWNVGCGRRLPGPHTS